MEQRDESRHNLEVDDDASTSTTSTMPIRIFANWLDSDLNPEGCQNVEDDIDGDGFLGVMVMAEQVDGKMMQEYFFELEA